MARAQRVKVPVTVRYGAAGPVLHQFAQSNKRVRLIIGPLGSGKTYTCIQELQKRIVTQKPNAMGERKSRWVAIRNTYPDLETTTIPDFREVFTDDFGTFKQSTPPRFTMFFGLEDNTTVQAEVFFLALDQPDDIRKLRGTQLTGGWINEAKEVPRDALDMLDSRIGRYPSRKDLGDYWHGIIGDSIAPDEDHWLAEFADKPPDGWEIFIQPGAAIWKVGKWEVNPSAENIHNLQPGYYNALIQGKRKDWIEVNVANKFGSVKDGRPVHPDFSKEWHVSHTPLEADIKRELYIGIDFGRTPAAAFFQRIGNQIRVIDELVTENMGALKFGQILKRHINEYYANFKCQFWGDPAGEDQAQTRDETPYDMLSAAGIDASPVWTNDFAFRQNSLDNLLTTAEEGQPLIMFDAEKCIYLIKGLNGGYQFRRLRVSGRDEFHDKPHKNIFSHVCEALHYGLMGSGAGEELIGFQDDGDIGKIESDSEFKGWHPKTVGV